MSRKGPGMIPCLEYYKQLSSTSNHSFRGYLAESKMVSGPTDGWMVRQTRDYYRYQVRTIR
jgi:hypothetical protein